MRQCAQEEASELIKEAMAKHLRDYHRGSATDGPLVAAGCGLPWLLVCLIAAGWVAKWLGIL